MLNVKGSLIGKCFIFNHVREICIVYSLYCYRIIAMSSFSHKELMSTHDKHVTVTADEIPLLYIEPGVVRGYRLENKPVTYYLKSIFQFHNETVNIWTHLIGFILMIKTCIDCLRSLENDVTGYSSVIVCFGICCAAYTFLSTTAHSIHSKSPTYHYVCYEMDYMGIGYYTLGSCILVYHLSWHETFYVIPDFIVLAFIVFMSVFGFVCCTISKLYYRRPYPPQRKLWNIVSFGLQCVFAFAGLIARYYDAYLNDEMSSLNYHTRYIVCIIISVLFFSSHIPETYFPGTFDYIGQGHHIFHVLSAFGSIQQFHAAMIDLRTYTPKLIKPIPRYIYCAFCAYTLLAFIALVIMYKYTQKRVKSDIEYEKARKFKTKKNK